MVYKVVYSVEVERQMDESEKAISEAVKSETGIEPHVEVLDRTELNIDGIGYSGFFLFSREIDGDSVYFEVDPDPVTIAEGEYLAGPGNDPEENTPTKAFIDRVFSDFTFSSLEYPLSPIHFDLPERNFSYFHPAEKHSFPIPAPPPERLA